MEGDSVEVGEAGKVAEARVGEELAAGPRCAMLTIERDGRRRPVRYGKRNPLGRWSLERAAVGEPGFDALLLPELRDRQQRVVEVRNAPHVAEHDSVWMAKVVADRDGHVADAGGRGHGPVGGGEFLVARAHVDERAVVRRERAGAAGVHGTNDDEVCGCASSTELGGRELVRGEEDTLRRAIERRKPLPAVGQVDRRRRDEAEERRAGGIVRGNWCRDGVLHQCHWYKTPC